MYSLRTGFHVPPLSYILRYCCGAYVSVCTYGISTQLHNSTVWRDYNRMGWRDCNRMDWREHIIGPLVHGIMIIYK